MMTNKNWKWAAVLACLATVAGGCVAAECRDGSVEVDGRCVSEAAGEGGAGGAAGDGGAGGMAGSAGAAGAAGAAGVGGGDGSDAGDLDAGELVPDAGEMMVDVVDAAEPLTCEPGYVPNSTDTACEDIDECAVDNGGCDPLTTCTNLPGSFECGECPTGYTGNALTGCGDVDECAVDSGGCDTLTTCMNLPGSFECGPCPSGYGGDGVSGCVDINECLTNNGGCSTNPMVTCTNIPGSRTCGACPSGYVGDGVTCTDVNECLTNNGGCDPAASCTNTPGSRTCGACPAGYTGNGAQANGCVPRLASLDVVPGPLGTAFSPTTLSYSASAGLLTRYAHVSATSLVPNAAITIGGVAADAHGTRFAWIGSAAASVPVVVSDAHGRSTTYEINVARVTPVTQRAYIKAPDSGQHTSVGLRTALDGNTLVAAGYESGLYGGAVRIFTRNGGTWVYQATINGMDATGSLQNQFGFHAMDIQGDTLAVAVPNYNRPNFGATGAVFVFRRNGTTWTQGPVLYASNSEEGDRFGESVAVYGDRIVVGASREDSGYVASVAAATNTVMDAGAVYVFARDGEQWTQEAYLKTGYARTGDYCGSAVDIYRDTLIVGCPGEDSSTTGINPGNNNSRSDSGAVYLFRRGSSGWSQLLYVKASSSTAAASAQFGYFVALGTEDHFAVASPGRSTPQVHVFGQASPGVWAQQADLASGSSGDLFGYGIGMWGPGTVAVHAPGDDSNSTGVNATRNQVADYDSGGMYVFLRATDDVVSFSREYFIKALNAEAADGFNGASFSVPGAGVYGDWVTLAAPFEDSSATGIVSPGPTQISDIDVSAIYNSGALYTFR